MSREALKGITQNQSISVDVRIFKIAEAAIVDVFVILNLLE